MLLQSNPSYTSGMLEWNYGAYRSHSNIPFMCKVPQACSNRGKTAFSVTAPKCWNTLLSALKFTVLPSLGQFKALISNYCISCNCFSWFGFLSCFIFFCICLYPIIFNSWLFYCPSSENKGWIKMTLRIHQNPHRNVEVKTTTMFCNGHLSLQT